MTTSILERILISSIKISFLFLFNFLFACQSKSTSENSTQPVSSTTVEDSTLNENKAYRNINFGISSVEYYKEEKNLLQGNNYENIGRYSFKLKPSFTNHNELYSLYLFAHNTEKYKAPNTTNGPNKSIEDELNKLVEDNYEHYCFEYLKELLFEKYGKYYKADRSEGNPITKVAHLTFQFGKKEILLRMAWDSDIILSFTDTLLAYKFHSEQDSTSQFEEEKEHKLERVKL